MRSSTRSTARKTLDQARDRPHRRAARPRALPARLSKAARSRRSNWRKAQDELKKADIGLASAKQGLQPAGRRRRPRCAQQAPARRPPARGGRRTAAPGRCADPARAVRRPGRPGAGAAGHQRGRQRAGAGVVDLSKFEVEIKVPESFARDLAIGMPAQITSNGTAVSGRGLGGVAGSRQRRGQRAPALRRRPAAARPAPEPAPVRAHRARHAPNVLMVERGPFLEQDGGRFAYVVDGGSAVRRRSRPAPAASARGNRAGLKQATASSSPAPTSSATRNASASRRMTMNSNPLLLVPAALDRAGPRRRRAAAPALSQMIDFDAVARCAPAQPCRAPRARSAAMRYRRMPPPFRIR